MDTGNWRPIQGASGAVADPSIESGDWRTQLQADSRQRIVNKIMETLKRHIPFSGNEGLQELRKIAVRFEEKIYTAATSQSDYLRKISLKMLSMENRSQNPMSDAMQSSSAPNSLNPSDPGSQVLQQGQQVPISVPSNNIQSGQHMMSQSMHSNIGSTGMQGSSSLSSALPPGSGLQQSTMANIAGQNTNLQNIQNMSGAQQSAVGNTMGPNNFANQRQQMQGRQQLATQQQQQQQQTQNSQYLYQQQLHQLAKQKLQHPSMQSNIQQQNLLQPGHMQTSQQSIMQPSVMQTSSLSSVVQNQQPVIPQSSQPLINHQQSVLRQRQQQVQPTQQNSMGQQANATNMQQNQLIGQQSNYSDVQQQQQQQRLIGQQNKLSSIQQPQQLTAQHNNFSSMQQQQSGQQQQQLLGSQSGNSNAQSHQHSGQQMRQPNMPMQQQGPQSSATLLPTQVQQSLTPLQQQVTPHMPSQPGQLQQQVGMQQQPNLQQDMQQRLPTSGVFQQQNMIDQQKQLFQQQRAMPEASSTSLDSTAQTCNPIGDWQEEVYQKIQAMKDMYLLDLNDMHQKILGKLQQCDSLPQQPKNEQLEKLKVFKNMLERFMQFLQIPKHAILANHKDKLSTYEKQIVQVINSQRRKPVGPQQQAQALHPSHMQTMQQSQQTHSQLTQIQSHETQMNLQGSMVPMQSNNMGSLQQSSAPSLSGGSNVQQNMMNSIKPGSNFDPGQNSSMNSLQQVSSGSLQQNTVSGPQQVNINPMSLHANSNMLQNQHIKQEQLLQSQQLKQLQQRQMQQQFLHKQQLMQQQQQPQFHQQTKQQQLSGQMQGNQLSQLHQINDGGDIKPRQQLSVKSGAFQQQHAAAAAAQRSAYHQQLRPGAPFSHQVLSSASPQMSQHASPQIDQSNMLKSANSPFTVPSPSASSASPITGELINGVPSLSNVGNIGQQQPSLAVLPAQSLAIGTPGISASPLLAEFTSPDGNHGAVASIGSGKSVAEQPLERLLRVVKSMSPKALSASVGDIGCVVSMVDRIAGSAPGNGSRAAVGEDMVAMTKCRLQARNVVTQDGANGTRKMKRFTSAMPLSVVSSAGSVNDSFNHLNASEMSELDSTASSIKRPRTESNYALLEEIKEINRGLIDTVVSISEEDADLAAASAVSEGSDGTVITCSFSAVALGPNLKSQYASAQMSPIQPLRLLVPASYPKRSPILMDTFPAEVSKEFEDISTKTRSRFSISLRSLSQPMSLKEIARTWDACAAAVISEYAQQNGGGTFSSKHGTWENCLTAA